jgi:hypothetical protein
MRTILLMLGLTLCVYAVDSCKRKSGDSATAPKSKSEVRKEIEDQQDVAEATSQLEKTFWEAMEANQPNYASVNYDCPVDGTQISVPSRKMNNGVGGIASDLMKIAIAPPEKGVGPPKLDVQEWQLALATCPTCGATFMEIDMVNFRNKALFPGAEVKLKQFRLSEASPALAAIEYNRWTADQHNYAHYLTLKQAGFPESELGFAALQCAYGTNFAVYYGDEYSVPSPAYYALAAAHMSKSVSEGPGQNPRAYAAVAMTCGELYRLLARPDDARAMFDKAAAVYKDAAAESPEKKFDEPALNALRALLDSGSTGLEQINVQKLDEPPIGWYLLMMLPNINAHISQHRGYWSKFDDAEEIRTEIEAQFAGKSAGSAE